MAIRRDFRALLGLFLFAVQTAVLANTHCAPDGRSITVTGTALVERPVQTVDIRASYTAEAPSPGKASRSLESALEPLLEGLEADIPEAISIEAARLSISPQWHSVDGERSIRGYQARRGLRLIAVPVDQAGSWVERLADAGPARLALENEQAGQADDPHAALTKAFANAREKAEALARQADRSLGAVHCVVDQSGDNPSTARQSGASAMLRQNDAGPPTLRPGTVSSRARVKAVFALGPMAASD